MCEEAPSVVILVWEILNLSLLIDKLAYYALYILLQNIFF